MKECEKQERGKGRWKGGEERRIEIEGRRRETKQYDERWKQRNVDEWKGRMKGDEGRGTGINAMRDDKNTEKTKKCRIQRKLRAAESGKVWDHDVRKVTKQRKEIRCWSDPPEGEQSCCSCWTSPKATSYGQICHKKWDLPASILAAKRSKTKNQR